MSEILSHFFAAGRGFVNLAWGTRNSLDVPPAAADFLPPSRNWRRLNGIPSAKSSRTYVLFYTWFYPRTQWVDSPVKKSKKRRDGARTSVFSIMRAVCALLYLILTAHTVGWFTCQKVHKTTRRGSNQRPLNHESSALYLLLKIKLPAPMTYFLKIIDKCNNDSKKYVIGGQFYLKKTLGG
jgi:hypothetical protein